MKTSRIAQLFNEVYFLSGLHVRGSSKFCSSSLSLAIGHNQHTSQLTAIAPNNPVRMTRTITSLSEKQKRLSRINPRLNKKTFEKWFDYLLKRIVRFDSWFILGGPDLVHYFFRFKLLVQVKLLNKQTQTNKQTDGQTVRQTDRQTDTQTDRQTDIQTDRQTKMH